jgi:hypothetical protein
MFGLRNDAFFGDQEMLQVLKKVKRKNQVVACYGFLVRARSDAHVFVHRRIFRAMRLSKIWRG